MRRVAFAVLSTAAALVMLLSFKTHSTVPAGTPPAAIATPGAGGQTGGSSTGSSTGTGTFTGDPADTRFGPVQVRITVSGGKVTAADAVEYPQESPRDQEINAYAIPLLNQEAVAAGTAGIDMVSGATYTSQGYLSSLQSALDKAGR
jgi:uncharacterized protein with FMN-binding domain